MSKPWFVSTMQARCSGEAAMLSTNCFQLVQAFVAVGKAPRSDALARFIQHLHVMMGVSPVQSNVPHARASLSAATPGAIGSLYNGCSKQRPSNHRLAQESCQGKNDLS